MSYIARNHPQQVGKWGALDSVDDRATTPEMFADLDDRFQFTIDVAASAANTKCERYYDREANGLAQPWAGERVWCNPPHSDMPAWVAKAHQERDADLILMLAPANRTEQAWWQDHIEPYRDQGARLSVEFLRGRTRFIRPGSASVGPNERPPYACCLLIWS